jgi:glycine hydroxymethyltransferase
MREPEMRRIGGWIGEVLADAANTAVQQRVRTEVRELCKQFPAPTNQE